MKPSLSKGAKAGAGARKKRSLNEAEGSAQGSTPPTSPPRPNPNKEWKKSKMRMPDNKVDDEDIIKWLGRIFKDMPPYTPCLVPEYSHRRKEPQSSPHRRRACVTDDTTND
jgi:hypothetical protein